MDWEKVFPNDETDKDLIPQINKLLMQLNKNTTQSKNVQKTYIDISPKKIYRWPVGT